MEHKRRLSCINCNYFKRKASFERYQSLFIVPFFHTFIEFLHKRMNLNQFSQFFFYSATSFIINILLFVSTLPRHWQWGLGSLRLPFNHGRQHQWQQEINKTENQTLSLNTERYLKFFTRASLKQTTYISSNVISQISSYHLALNHIFSLADIWIVTKSTDACCVENCWKMKLTCFRKFALWKLIFPSVFTKYLKAIFEIRYIKCKASE